MIKKTAPSPKRNPFRYLKPVLPEDFLGRWPLVKDIALDLSLENGDSWAIIGGRRFGKSSLLIALHHYLREISSFEVDYVGFPIHMRCKRYNFKSEDNFFAILLQEVYDRISNTSRRHIKDPYSVGVSLDRTLFDRLLTMDPPRVSLSEFEEILDYILDRIQQPNGPARLVILLDEIDDTLRYPWCTVLFNQLRSCIYDGDLSDRVRLVLAGSRRFLDEVSDAGSPLWNILKLHYLTTFDEPTTQLLSQQADNIPEAIQQAIWSQSGGHPFLAQYLLHHLWEIGISQINLVTITHIVDRFLHEEQAHLEGWAGAIGSTGLQIYGQILKQDDWISEMDLIRAIGDPNIYMKRGLAALYYHGFIIHDGNWDNYHRTGDLLHKWYIQEGQRFINSLSAEKRDNNRPQNTYNFLSPIQASSVSLGVNTINEEVINMGDKIRISNVQGSNINVKARLDNITQTISTLPNTDQATRDELVRLTEELNGLLQKVPQDKSEDAEKASKRVEVLVEEAGKPKPDKEVVEFNVDSLKKAAANIGTVLPTVLMIADQIVSHITKLIK